jgi:hypothetical protein
MPIAHGCCILKQGLYIYFVGCNVQTGFNYQIYLSADPDLLEQVSAVVLQWVNI